MLLLHGSGLIRVVPRESSRPYGGREDFFERTREEHKADEDKATLS
jgi:hypothetical protein